MRTRLIAAAAACFIFSSAVEAQVGITSDRVAQCEYEARLFAEGRIVMTHRIKVPIGAAIGWLASGGSPVGAAIGATIAANAESPLERRAVVAYRNWCLGLGPAPRGLL